VMVHSGYFFNGLTRDCVPCSFCYPDYPGLTLPVKQCAVRGQPALYRCLPVVNPSPPVTTAPSPPSVTRDDVGVRRRHRRRQRRRRRQQRAGRAAGRGRRNGRTQTSVTTMSRTSETNANAPATMRRY